MKKKQFLSKLAALTMVAAMGLTAVPATAINAFAASITADTFDTKSSDSALNSAVAAALNSKTFDATTTADNIKSWVQTYLNANGYSGATAVVTIAAPTASSLNKTTDINGNVSYALTVGKLPVSIAVTASKTVDQTTTNVSGNYTANIPIDNLTTAEKVTLAKTIATDAANSVAFGAKDTPNAAVIVKAINDKFSALSSTLSSLFGGNDAVSATNVTFTSTGDTVEGTITLSAGTKTDSDDDVSVLNKKVEDSTATFSIARSAAASQITDVKAYLEGISNIFGGIKNDTTSDEIVEKANALIAGNSTYKSSGVKVTAATFVNDTKTKFGETKTQMVLLTLSDGTNTLTATINPSRTLSDDEYLAAAEEGVEKAASLIDVSDYQDDDAVTPLADDSADQTASDNNSIQDLAANVIAAARTYKPNKDQSATVASISNLTITVKDIDYTKSTVSKEGKAVVTVKYSVPNDDYDTNDDSTEQYKTATSTFTVTFPKLKASPAATLAIGTSSDAATTKTALNEIYTKNRNVQLYGIQTNSDGDTANDELTWSSDNGDVAVVDENGKVTLKGIGTATITVTSKTNSSLTDSLTLIVKLADSYKFTDVQDPDSYYFTAVYQGVADVLDDDDNVVRVKYVDGTSDTTFSPNKNVTRAEFVTFLWRLAGKPNAKESNFSDVKEGSFYEEAVNWASQEGITEGKSENTFDPDAYVTRAEAVTFLYRAFGESQSFGAVSFDDVDDAAYYAKAVSWAVANRITSGTSVKKFSPDDYATRAQAVTFIDNSRYGYSD